MALTADENSPGLSPGDDGAADDVEVADSGAAGATGAAEATEAAGATEADVVP